MFIPVRASLCFYHFALPCIDTMLLSVPVYAFTRLHLYPEHFLLVQAFICQPPYHLATSGEIQFTVEHVRWISIETKCGDPRPLFISENFAPIGWKTLIPK